MVRILLYASVLIMLFQLSCGMHDRGSYRDDTAGGDTLLPDMHTSRIALDYHGVYEGIMTCASCSGIYTRIELREDDTYLIKRKYLGVEGDNVFYSEGRFTWDDSGGNIFLEGEDVPNKYMVGENQLIHLDSEGLRIRGELEEYYILRKK